MSGTRKAWRGLQVAYEHVDKEGLEMRLLRRGVQHGAVVGDRGRVGDIR